MTHDGFFEKIGEEGREQEQVKGDGVERKSINTVQTRERRGKGSEKCKRTLTMSQMDSTWSAL